MDLHGSPGYPLPFPQLQELELKGLEQPFDRKHRQMGKHFVPRLLSMLETRLVAGLPRLEDLHIFHVNSRNPAKDRELLEPYTGWLVFNPGERPIRNNSRGEQLESANITDLESSGNESEEESVYADDSGVEYDIESADDEHEGNASSDDDSEDDVDEDGGGEPEGDESNERGQWERKGSRRRGLKNDCQDGVTILIERSRIHECDGIHK